MKRLAPCLLLAALAVGPALADDAAPATPPAASPVDADYKKVEAVIEKLQARPAEAERNRLLDELLARCDEFLTAHAAVAPKEQLVPAAGMWFQLSLQKGGDLAPIRARREALGQLKDPPAELTDMLGKVDGALRSAEAKANIAVGKKAPNWTAQDVHDGSQVTLESLRGKVVLMDFWATWCPPCKQLMARELAPLHARYKDTAGFVLVGVGLPWRGDTAEKEKEFGDAQGYRWKKVFDPTGAAAESYGVEGIPFLCLVDGEGTILAVGNGGSVIGEVKRILAERFGPGNEPGAAPATPAPGH